MSKEKLTMHIQSLLVTTPVKAEKIINSNSSAIILTKENLEEKGISLLDQKNLIFIQINDIQNTYQLQKDYITIRIFTGQINIPEDFLEKTIKLNDLLFILIQNTSTLEGNT